MELALIATGLIDAVFSGSLLKMYSAKRERSAVADELEK